MPPEQSTAPDGQPLTAQVAALAEQAVEDLVDRLVARLTPDPGPRAGDPGDRPGGGPDAVSGPVAASDSRTAGEPLGRALLRLRVLAQLQQAVDASAAAAAADAARLGAGYPRLGRAWGITRQGARRRWPGLAFAHGPARHPTDIHRSTLVNSPNSLMPQRSYDVLLVEDDEADALLIEEALSVKATVRSVARSVDGVAALEYLRDPGNPRPDLIVLDLNMPRMNGRELLAVLKNDPDLGMIPVVVLTTSSTPDDVKAAYRQHANAYVTKPVNLDDFLRAVRGIDDFFLETATVPKTD